MAICNQALDLYGLAILMLLIVLAGLFLGIVVLTIKCARIKAQLDLFRSYTEVDPGSVARSRQSP